MWDAPPRGAVGKTKKGLAKSAGASKRSIRCTRVVQDGVAKEETGNRFERSSTSSPEALFEQRWEEEGADQSTASNERRLQLQRLQRQEDWLLSKNNPASVPFLERRQMEGDKTSPSRQPDFNAETTTDASSKSTNHTHVSMNSRGSSWSGEAPPRSHINNWTECETGTGERDKATTTAVDEADTTCLISHRSNIRSRDGDGFIVVGDAGGRDSEWMAERRAANREAVEVLSALRNNSSRLWQLVGGGV